MSSPTSPRLLLISELLRLICEQCEKPTLASLAATCKAFERPALDVLWFDLDDFYHLVMCIPEIFRVEETRKVYGEDIKHVLHQGLPLVSGALTRFSTYTEKVHRVTFHGTSPQKLRVDTSILRALQICCPRKSLLPNLRNLTWLCSEKDNLPYVFLFLGGPRLSEVTFRFRSPSSTFQQMALLPTLCDNYPLIKKVVFTYASPPTNTPDEEIRAIRATNIMSSSISKWRSLESLIITSVSYTAMREISLLPSLKELEVLQLNETFIGPSTNIRKGGFPVLECLKLGQSVTAPECISVLELLDMSPLHTLGLWLREAVSGYGTWKRLFDTIEKHCDHSALIQIYCAEGVSRDVTNIPIPQDEILSYADIKPLLAFQNLEKLHIRTICGFYLSDAKATSEMAENWTRIKRLGFSAPPGDRLPRTSTITLLDLIPFAEHCPNLENLSGITVDACDPPAINDKKRPGNGVYQTALTQIDFGRSPAKFPARIAAFLSSCFPSLETIKSSHERSIDMEDSWKIWDQVQDMLSVFAAVRMQERSDPGAPGLPSL